MRTGMTTSLKARPCKSDGRKQEFFLLITETLIMKSEQSFVDNMLLNS